MVKPLSAITDIPEAFCSWRASIKPDTLVSYTSEIEPTYKGEMYITAPLGVHANKNLAVLCDL